MKPDDDNPLRRQASETLRRARATPRGPFRNDLRQLATALRGLERQQHALSRESIERHNSRHPSTGGPT